MKYLLSLLILCALFLIPCFAQTKEGVKIDDVANAQCDDYLGRTIVYVDELKKTPKAKAFVIIYEGKTIKGLYDKNATSYDTEKYVQPRFGLANELVRTIKIRLTFLGLKEKEIVFIKGGFRENLSIELWIVPNGKESPKPTPTLNKIRYRRGRPRGYCITI